MSNLGDRKHTSGLLNLLKPPEKKKKKKTKAQQIASAVFNSGFIDDQLVVDEEEWCFFGQGPNLFEGPNRLVLEKTVWPVFNWKICMREFLRHALIPFTLPYYLYNYQTSKRQLIFRSWKNHLLLQIAAWGLLIWFIVRKNELEAAGISAVEILSMFLCAMIHRLCISIKYAYLTEEEYEEFHEAATEQALKWLVTMQILSSWVNPSLDMVLHEVWIAAQQLNMKLTDLYIHIHPQDAKNFEQYVKVTNTNLKQFAEIKAFQTTEVKVSLVQVVAAAFLNSSAHNKMDRMMVFARIVAVARGILFAAMRLGGDYKYKCLGQTWESAVVTLLSAYTVYYFYRILLLFVFGNVVDTVRRLCVVRDVGDFIRSSYERRPGHPRIQLAVVENIRSWVALRRLVLRVGYRFRRRLSVYSRATQIISVGCVIETLVLFLTAPNPADLSLDPQFIQSIFDFAVLSVPMLLNLYVCMTINMRIQNDMESVISNRIGHRFRMIEKKRKTVEMKLRESIASDVSDAEEASVTSVDKFLMQTEYDVACDDLLDTAVQALQGIDKRPLTFFGVRADMRTLTSVVTFSGTLYGFVIKRVFFPNMN